VTLPVILKKDGFNIVSDTVSMLQSNIIPLWLTLVTHAGYATDAVHPFNQRTCEPMIAGSM
jgi:hypothetical protein